MSVVFDFNASLNDVAPVSPISLSVDVIQHKNIKRPFSCEICLMISSDFLPSKSISLQGTMFIKRQTRSIVNSPLIRPVHDKMSLPHLPQIGIRQTVQIDVLFPFPIVDEPHQTKCFMVSFVCSLGN